MFINVDFIRGNGACSVADLIYAAAVSVIIFLFLSFVKTGCKKLLKKINNK
mgnify:CR=1 FL=1